MRVRAVVAVDPQGAIGREGDVPWDHPEDRRFFARTTMGGVVVMGRRTYDSIGAPLAGRTNVVLTRTPESRREDSGVVWASDPDAALRLARDRGDDLFVVGGAEVYELFRDRIDEWLVTRVPERVVGADTFLPAELLDGFRRVRSEALGPGLTVDHLRRPTPESGRRGDADR